MNTITILIKIITIVITCVLIKIILPYELKNLELGRENGDCVMELMFVVRLFSGTCPGDRCCGLACGSVGVAQKSVVLDLPCQ